MWRTALVLLLIPTACGGAAAPTANLASPTASTASSTRMPVEGSDSPVPYPTYHPAIDQQPLPRGSGMMGWDDALGELVFFGGENSNSILSDTWTWDGRNWTYAANASPASAERANVYGPEARTYATMFYDPISRSMILFGGRSAADTMLSDTWSWSGSWAQLEPSRSPSPRSLAAAAYDPALKETILEGGWGGNTTLLSDTWTWNGSTWSVLNVSGSPPGTFGAVLGYHASGHDMQLVPLDGGSVWRFDGGAWAAVTTGGSAPSCRYGNGAANPEDSTIVVFGGNCTTNIWDGASWWSPPASAAQPSQRGDEGGSPMMAYAQGRGIILYGGRTGGSDPASDLWIWNGALWHQQE